MSDQSTVAVEHDTTTERRTSLVIERKEKPPVPHVIAFVNHSSGSGKGDQLTKMLTQEIGATNIYRLGGGSTSPKIVIEDVYRAHPEGYRIIVCGGDGSVNWILSLIADLGYTNVAVGIIPNGTGNDTSRFLGWGQCQFNDKTTHSNVIKMIDPTTPIIEFDRWQLFFSFRKDEMLARTQRIRKTNEVPIKTHVYKLEATPPPQCDKLTTSDLMKMDKKEKQIIQEQSSSNNTSPEQQLTTEDTLTSSQTNTSQQTTNETKQSTSQQELVEYFFPKYFKSITRLDELQFLERYKFLHPDLQPQSYTQLTPDEQRTSKLRLSTNVDTGHSHVLPSTQQNSNPNQKQLYAQLLENTSKWFRFTWSFNNYFSLGIDAQAMNYFGIHRDNNPCCYQCRCCTMTWIGTCSTATCISCQKKPLQYRIDILYKSEDLIPEGATPTTNSTPHPTDPITNDISINNKPTPSKSINAEDGEDISITIQTTHPTIDESNPDLTSWANQDELPFIDNPNHLTNGFKWLSAVFDPLQYGALVLLNIPSYAGGRNIWGTKSQMGPKAPWLHEEVEQATNDGKLELVAFTGFNQLQFTILTQSATYRLGQIQGIRLYMANDAYVQLDGEAWIQPQGILEIYRSTPAKMLYCPDPHYPAC